MTPPDDVPAPPLWPTDPQGQPPYGQAPYGQPPYGQAPHAPVGGGQPPYGQPPYAPAGGHPPYGQPSYGQPPHGPVGGGRPAEGPPGSGPYGGPSAGPLAGEPSPAAMVTTASWRVRAASAVQWLLLLAWAAFMAAGLAALRGSGGEPFEQQAAVDDADLLFGLGMLGWLAAGAATWALLALWCSWTSRARTASGNDGGSSRSSWAWWGVFVPPASLVLPYLAYVEAAKYALASERTGGQGRGRGGGWRREPLPLLLAAWWALHVGATAAFLLAFSQPEEALRGYGVALVLLGLLGAGSSVCGALVLRRLARATMAAGAEPRELPVRAAG